VSLRYREMPPPADLATIVQCFWALEADKGALEAAEPVLPDGCIEMVFHVEGRFRSNLDARRPQPEALVVGQVTRPFHLRASERVRTFGVRFRPGGPGALLPMPLHLLTDREEALDGLLGASGTALSRRVRSADSDEERVAAVATELRRGRRISVPPPLHAALDAISRRRGALRAGELRGLGLCDRQLRRMFRDAVGIGPKALCRIVRLRAAFAAHQAGVAWAEAALEAGFCDQAHLARESRALLGAPPTALEDRGPLAGVFGVAATLDPAV
jgi:hypothetical protein